jgi:hypothetical protein
MWKEAIVTVFKVLCTYLPERTKEDHENSRSAQSASQPQDSRWSFVLCPSHLGQEHLRWAVVKAYCVTWHQNRADNEQKMPENPHIQYKREKEKCGGNTRTGADMRVPCQQSVCTFELSNKFRTCLGGISLPLISICWHSYLTSKLKLSFSVSLFQRV